MLRMASVREIVSKNPWSPSRPIYPYPDAFAPKYLPDWPKVLSVEFVAEYAEDFAGFPDLVEAMRALEIPRVGLLAKRREMTPGAHLSYSILKKMREKALARGEELMVVRHPPALTAREHLAAVKAQAETLGLSVLPTVLKTVTLKFPLSDGTKRIALYSGVGDFQVSKPTKRSIAEVLGLPSWSAKNVTINPESFNPREIGYIRGQVKPFLCSDCIHRINALCYAHKMPEDPATHIAVTASLFDSVILPIEDLEAILGDHLAGLPLTPVSSGQEGLDMYIVQTSA